MKLTGIKPKKLSTKPKVSKSQVLAKPSAAIPVTTPEKQVDAIPRLGIFGELKFQKMAKNTSILLGEYFEQFISQQIKSGKYSSASEVVRAALRMFEYEESRKTELIKELKKGENSGFIENFDRKEVLKKLHTKHQAE